MSRLPIRPIAIAALTTLLATACTTNDQASTPAASSNAAAEQNRSVGIVQSIDTAAGSITIAHEPIEALGWPAMTMAFKVARPELLQGVVTGERIEFTLQGRDMAAVITSIEAAN